MIKRCRQIAVLSLYDTVIWSLSWFFLVNGESYNCKRKFYSTCHEPISRTDLLLCYNHLRLLFDCFTELRKKSPNNSKRHPPPPSVVVRRGARCVANSSPRLNAQVLQTLGRTEYAGEFRTWHSDIYAIGQVEAWVLSSRRVFEAIFVLFGMKSVASRSMVYCTLLRWFVVTCEFCLLWKFSWLRFSYSSSVLICRTLEKANENRLNGLKWNWTGINQPDHLMLQ